MGDLGPHEDECAGIPDLAQRHGAAVGRRATPSRRADLLLHGEPYSHDSRGGAQAPDGGRAELGYTPQMGVEPEVYVLREVDDGTIVPFVAEDVAQRADAGLRPRDDDPRRRVPRADGRATSTSSAGTSTRFDHEGGDGQYEFDFGYTDALEMADRMLIFRLMAKHVARTLGCFATFMPKPFVDSFGSGGHLNMSLADAAGDNAFAGRRRHRERARPGYTDLAYQFTAGVLRHARRDHGARVPDGQLVQAAAAARASCARSRGRRCTRPTARTTAP